MESLGWSKIEFQEEVKRRREGGESSCNWKRSGLNLNDLRQSGLSNIKQKWRSAVLVTSNKTRQLFFFSCDFSYN